ncbi:MAG: DUF370 domain-containing protein [Nitrospirae bacterium]|nr:DUF370 domain-containing protein [Nitrospirota bacterium]NTW64992.1 DUF370 domain-containing protein [Nitrospirota bacterium]
MAAILAPEWAPMRCPKDDTEERNMPVDASQRSIVITGSGHVILSAVQVEKLAQRFCGGNAA